MFDGYTKDFSAGAIQTVPYTKDFTFDAQRRVSYTQDFSINAGQFKLAGIVWFHLIDYNIDYARLFKFPSTLPQTKERLLRYNGIIRMEKAHQWDTSITAQTVRQDIIKRIGHVTFKSVSLTAFFFFFE